MTPAYVLHLVLAARARPHSRSSGSRSTLRPAQPSAVAAPYSPSPTALLLRFLLERLDPEQPNRHADVLGHPGRVIAVERLAPEEGRTRDTEGEHQHDPEHQGPEVEQEHPTDLP